MPRVEFLEDFGWIDPRLIVRKEIFKAGQVRLVTTPCATAAIAAGKAKRIQRDEVTGDSGGSAVQDPL